MTKEFGELVTHYRELGLDNKSAVEERAGFGNGYLSHLEKGDFNPSAESAIILAEVLEVPDDQLAEFLLLASGHSGKVVSEITKEQRLPKGLLPGEGIRIETVNGELQITDLD